MNASTSQAYTGEELCCDAGGYLKLKKLGLHQLENLQYIRLAKGAMTGISRLDITACEVLETVPVGIEHLKSIEYLVLWEMPSKFINKIKRSLETSEVSSNIIPAKFLRSITDNFAAPPLFSFALLFLLNSLSPLSFSALSRALTILDHAAKIKSTPEPEAEKDYALTVSTLKDDLVMFG
ncbi:unnamed protein product [Dovyalis caffra]|uniref:Uncharacterized protein n=1 Tax=Dovyalis caffra TaxID=77055 RepID=A0AAV1SI95_9ROSI|nr:unnamed protein product [Dovyalis caffra]